MIAAHVSNNAITGGCWASFAMEYSDRLSLLETGIVERSGTATEFRNDDYVRDAYIGVI